MLKICDAHNDMLYKFTHKNELKNYLDKLPKCVEMIFCAYFSYNNTNANIFDMKKKFSYLKEKKYIKTVENAWFLNLKNVDDFVLEKPFCIALCHNQNTKLCGGAEDNGTITSLGKQIIKILERNKIIIDTAHMNEKSFYEFLKITKYPIFNSHTAFFEKFKHNRNLKNWQIEEIINSGGFVGLALYPKFFSYTQYKIYDLAKNILWFLEKFGTKTLGFGTDFNGIDEFIEDIDDYNKLYLIENEIKKFGIKNVDIKNLFSQNLTNFYFKMTNKNKN